MLAPASVACVLLLALGLAMRLLGLPAGGDVLAAAFALLISLPVVRLAWVLVDLARSRQWTYVLVGLAVAGLLGSTLLWPAG